MKIERVISCFDIKTEELQNEYNVDHINFDVLKNIFKPREDDPLMYNPYTILEQQASELKELVDIEFDLGHFFYQIDCFEV